MIPEKLFILDCMRAFIHETVVSPAWNERSLSTLNWDLVIRTGQKGRILPFLVHTFEKEEYSRFFSKEDQLEWEGLLIYSEWENQKKLKEFKKIKDLFELNSIPLIPLKGIALSHLVYDRTPYRLMSDIDVLIHKSDLQKTQDILSAEGFVLREPKNRWQAKPTMKIIGRWDFMKDQMNLDLQWAPRFFIENQWVPWGGEEVWQRAESFKSLGENVFMLSTPDQAQYLLFQILNDMEINYIYVSQLLDLALVMKKYRLTHDQILGTARTLSASLQAKLTDFLQNVETCFFGDQFVEKAACFVDLFFESSRELRHDFALKQILRFIQSPWERTLFLIGYFVPSKSLLREKKSFNFFSMLAFFLDHWKKQCLSLFRVLLKQ